MNFDLLDFFGLLFSRAQLFVEPFRAVIGRTHRASDSSDSSGAALGCSVYLNHYPTFAVHFCPLVGQWQDDLAQQQRVA